MGRVPTVISMEHTLKEWQTDAGLDPLKDMSNDRNRVSYRGT